MTWSQVEKIFNRALAHAFSKQKFWLVFPVLALCGFLAAICRVISVGVSQWMVMSTAFLPIFFCAGLLLAVGIVLVRIYHDEVKNKPFQYIRVIKGAKQLYLGIPYLAVPLIFAYLILWMVLGVFYLFRAIPHAGPFISSLLAFGPFLLVLGSIALGVLSLLVLFYVTPAAAFKTELKAELAEEVLADLKVSPFLSFLLPLIALLPLALTIGILSLAAALTRLLYIDPAGSLSMLFRWLLIMLPFCGLLTPAVIFFFNFSAEGHAVMHKKLAKS